MVRVVFIAAAASMVGACMPAAAPSLTAAADPTIDIRQLRYSTVTAGVRDYRPVGPRDWRELNREVAPEGARERGDESAARARRGR
jgi:hypothetical protein